MCPNHYDEGKYCFLSPLWSVMFHHHCSTHIDLDDLKETPHLNSEVIDCFMFNRGQLHSDTDLDDIKVIYSIDSGMLSSGPANAWPSKEVVL